MRQIETVIFPNSYYRYVQYIAGKISYAWHRQLEKIVKETELFLTQLL